MTINWILATPENVAKHFKNEIEQGSFLAQRTPYVFLSKQAILLDGDALYITAWENALYIDNEYDQFDVTHFALRSEFESILPKEDS